jgi:hypothetical protein
MARLAGHRASWPLLLDGGGRGWGRGGARFPPTCILPHQGRGTGGEDFPGVLGRLARTGSGRTRALADVAVVVTDQQLENPGSLALIDLSGPAATLTEFARTMW